MNVGHDCKLLCEKPTVFEAEKANAAHYRIEQEYFVHLIIDNLPCATQFQMPDTNEFQYEPGFRLGFVKDGKAYINNHLNLILSYHHNLEDDQYRVVGFLVETASIDKDSLNQGGDAGCSVKENGKFQEIKKGERNEVYFTYSVKWKESDIRWASRWDIYLNMADVQIHWFSIVNSVVVVFFLSGIITMIIIRTLRRYLLSCLYFMHSIY